MKHLIWTTSVHYRPHFHTSNSSRKQENCSSIFENKKLNLLFSALFNKWTPLLRQHLSYKWNILYDVRVLMPSNKVLKYLDFIKCDSPARFVFTPIAKLQAEDEEGKATGWLGSSWQVEIGVIYHLWNGLRAYHTNHDSARCSNWSKAHKYTNKGTHKHKSYTVKWSGTCKNMPLSFTKKSRLKWTSKHHIRRSFRKISKLFFY